MILILNSKKKWTKCANIGKTRHILHHCPPQILVVIISDIIVLELNQL